MRRLFPALALTPTLLVALHGRAPAAPPSESSRFLVAYRMQIRGLSPFDLACSGDVDPATAPKLLRTIDRALGLVAPRVSALSDAERHAPEVRCALMHVDALARCAETVRASLDGSAEKEPRPSDPFVAALDKATRGELTSLYRYFTGKSADLPARAADLNRLLVAADVAEVMCKGRFASHIATPPDGDPPPDDANPWGWCSAVAAKAELAQRIGSAMIGNAKATLSSAKGDLESRANGLASELSSEAERVWDEAAAVRAAAEDLAAIHQLVGLPVPHEIDDLTSKARSRASAVLDQVLAKIPGMRARESDKKTPPAPAGDARCDWQTAR